ncbi:probable Allantoicase [Saccharomycodes ludwigii]|uniref:allantoicase n=1 Tax=Saccharomycodes ludwigii TaxID=36035 RepID=A0A376B8I4_9ASCO|nr:hypothetical protein SCDLUD_004361 [Saccharomycodes ludwigii]KAH3900044.1 hypothetical protein SCDLUD_004361 [Saccharomycodes ludwigii]SSD60869.1 probable Allantoicase [Saccharomycodes ludwigii]
MTTTTKVTAFDKNQQKVFDDIIINKYNAVDIIAERLGGEIVAVSNEWFAKAENLIKPNKPIRDATRFVYQGAWYDGWETRRHNSNEYDYVIFKIGVSSASIIGCEIDTAFFDGNHAPYISVEALYNTNEGKDAVIEENNPGWEEVIGKMECGPSQKQFFLRDNGLTLNKYTHVKLKMYPDGGIARFRLYGKVILPELNSDNVNTVTDLCNVCNGAVAIKCSDEHFGTMKNLILPGRGCDMSDGWETKRSRIPNHVDWSIIKLGRKTSYIDHIVVDTAHFRGNFPQSIKVYGALQYNGNDDTNWIELVPQSKTGPDKEHLYQIKKNLAINYIKLVIIPDGGVKRIRVFGY